MADSMKGERATCACKAEGEIIAQGTLQELRVRAGMGNDEAARLEAIFLKLTTDEEMVEIVEALRR